MAMLARIPQPPGLLNVRHLKRISGLSCTLDRTDRIYRETLETVRVDASQLLKVAHWRSEVRESAQGASSQLCSSADYIEPDGMSAMSRATASTSFSASGLDPDGRYRLSMMENATGSPFAAVM